MKPTKNPPDATVQMQRAVVAQREAYERKMAEIRQMMRRMIAEHPELCGYSYDTPLFLSEQDQTTE